MDTGCGDIKISDTSSGSKIYQNFKLLGPIYGLDNDMFVYGEIAISTDLSYFYDQNIFINVKIPYIPEVKQLSIRFRIENNADIPEYAINPTNNKTWFNVTSPVNFPTPASQFVMTNDEFDFLLAKDLIRGTMRLFSGRASDFYFDVAMEQNKILMLQCFPTNLYQFPTTGVGLVGYLNANIETSNLGKKLISEFAADKVTVLNSNMEYDTNKLYLEIQEQNG